MAARSKNRGLVFLRRSSGKQESSLQAQLEWAIGEAARHEVRLDASLDDLAYMQAHGLHSYKDIRLDDAITGADLDRPGFVALQADIILDPSISHVIFMRRDRLARPEDAHIMVGIEKEIRQAGVTFVMHNKIGRPLERGLTDIGEEISMWFDYYESGEFLRKHAERIISTKILLVKGGYWSGGRAPFGFARVLVDAAGTVVEELAEGRRVRQAGCHVRVMPKDADKIGIWCYILDLKHKGWGATRIGNHLNSLGIPSPDAGRTRTDHGRKHLVSGLWSTRTVLELCRNKAILGIVELGRRSEGVHRRVSKDGPRLLTDQDRDSRKKNKPKRIQNSSDNILSNSMGFESRYDSAKWAEIAEQLHDRGKNQRGVPRAKNPARYPLATRVVDLTDGCGALMYGQPSGERKRYTCGRYMRSCSSECYNNTVDAEALLRFTIATLQQYAVLAGGHEQIRRQLEELAANREVEPAVDPVQVSLTNLESRRQRVAEDVEIAGRRMLLEKNDDRYQLLSKEYDRLLGELQSANTNLEAARYRSQKVRPLDQEVEEAVALLAAIQGLTDDESSRLKMAELAKRMGLLIGLNFTAAIKGTKRPVRKLTGGLITFGEQGLPVPLFGNRRVGDGPCDSSVTDDGLEADNNGNAFARPGVVTAVAGETATAASSGLIRSREEGISSTKLSRGDWI
jgi:hypothetical protein